MKWKHSRSIPGHKWYKEWFSWREFWKENTQKAALVTNGIKSYFLKTIYERKTVQKHQTSNIVLRCSKIFIIVEWKSNILLFCFKLFTIVEWKSNIWFGFLKMFIVIDWKTNILCWFFKIVCSSTIIKWTLSST